MPTPHLDAKKSLGQHFLTSSIVPGWMCDAAAITPGDTIIEIGPGTGVLTTELLRRGATVIALEADTRALSILEETFPQAIEDGTLVLHHADVRSGALSDYLPAGTARYKVVANIPYYLSGLLFRSTLTDTVQPESVVYLVQKEVAKRAYTPTDYTGKHSLLSLSVAVYGTSRYVKTVTRGHFTPPPRVDSAIIAIDGISRDFFADCDEALFFRVLHLGFGSKRKQLLHNLATTYERTEAEAALKQAGLPATVRAEDVSPKEWRQLVQVLSTLNTA